MAANTTSTASINILGGRVPPNRTAFNKDYLPGYTGHIPYKKEIYGCTLGDINKIVMGKPTSKVSNFDVDEFAAILGTNQSSLQTLPQTGSQDSLNTGSQAPPPYGQRTMYSKPPPKDTQGLSLQFGNISKRGENWIGGPTSNASAQHVPGYQGYVPSIKAENLYGQSFGKTTSKAINKDYPKDPGVGKPPLGSGVDRYKTQNCDDFSKDNFRRIVNSTVEPADVIDRVDTQNIEDEEFQGIQVSKPNIYMTIQTVGYQGFKSNYRVPTVATYHRKQPQFNVNSLQPRLPASVSNQILPTQTSPYESQDTLPNVSDGFQRTLSVSKTRMTMNGQDPDNKKIPVVGYTGHRMGHRAQGFFGKNFRDCSIQSRNIQKAFGGAGNSNSQSHLATY